MNYPYWYRNFIKLLATAPNQLPTIVRNADTLSNNYSFVKLCYQDIMFSLNGSKIDGYWHPLFKSYCHVFDVKTGRILIH